MALAYIPLFRYEAAMSWRRGILIALIAQAAMLLALTASARAAELLLFTRKSCAYCQIWERQIGPIYPKTDESRIAPLRRIDLDATLADLPALNSDVSITPTFVLVDGGREIGRFSGYSDDLSFWAMLESLLKKLDVRPSPASYSLVETAP